MPIILAQATPPAAVAPALKPSVITAPDWALKPVLPDVARLYPKEAAAKGVEGQATIGCTVGSEGRLHDCQVLAEEPADAGFGDAALKLSLLFKMHPMTKDGVPVSGGHINIPIRFQLPAPPPDPTTNASQIITPDWRRKPTGEDLARVYPDRARRANLPGQALMRCEVTAQGTLRDCAVLSESPPGEGFGAAAVKLAKIFAMRPLTREGAPVAGGFINIPIRFWTH